MHHSSPAVTMGLRTTKLVQWFWRHGACWSQIILFCFINFHLFVDLACHATTLFEFAAFLCIGRSTFSVDLRNTCRGSSARSGTHSFIWSTFWTAKLVPLDVQSTFCTYIQMGSLAGAQLATSRILEAQPHPENVNFVVQKPSF